MSAVDVMRKLAFWAADTTCSMSETNERVSVRAAVAELIEAANRMTDFADDEYVPNTVFARLTQAIRRCGAAP